MTIVAVTYLSRSFQATHSNCINIFVFPFQNKLGYTTYLHIFKNQQNCWQN